MKLFQLSSAVLCAFLLAGCGRERETGPKIESLQFPVVVLFENSATRLCAEPSELTNVHTNYLKLNSETPVLVDSDFKIFSLEKFQSVHGGLWLMAHPSERTEVTFDLKAQSSGRDAARELFARQIEKQDWRRDREVRQKALGSEQTLLGMVMLAEREQD